MARLDETRKLALELPLDDRSVLVEELIDSLAADDERAFDLDHLDDWHRRYRELHAEPARGVTLDDVTAASAQSTVTVTLHVEADAELFEAAARLNGEAAGAGRRPGYWRDRFGKR